VTDEQLAIDQVKVSFHGGEAHFERIEERALVLVIIVREAIGDERCWFCAGTKAFTDDNQENERYKDASVQASASSRRRLGATYFFLLL